MSDSIPDISRLLACLVDFSADTRLYDLDTPLGADLLLVERYVGKEELSALYEFHVDCLCTDTHLDLRSLLGQQATLRTRLPDGSQDSRSGYIAEIAQLGADGGLARYRLTLVPWLALARYQRRSRVYQDVPLLQIIEEVLDAYAPRAHWRATTDAQSLLARVRPRSYCCQYRESDYSFVARLLAEEGIGFYFEETEAGDPAVSRQRLVLFGDSTAFREDAAAARDGSIRFHRDASVEQQDSIQGLGNERRLQPAITTVSSWDYKAKRVITASLPTAHDFGGPNAPRIECNDWAGIYAFANRDEAEHYARLLREGTDARFKSWFGHGSVRGFRPATAFTLRDSPFEPFPDTGNDPQRRRFALLGVLQAGVNNLPLALQHAEPTPFGASFFAEDSGLPDEDWPASSASPLPLSERAYYDELNALHDALWAEHDPILVQRPLSESDLDPDAHAGGYLDVAAWARLLQQARATGYANRFTAIRSDIIWRPALYDGTGELLNPRPTVHGSQTALVVGPDGSCANPGTVHTDALGRIRIRYHWQDAEARTCWVRVAQMFAGPGYGAQFIPRIGQEVMVAFLDGDIDRPLVTGALYNGRGQDDPEQYAQAGDHAAAAQDNRSGGAAPAWHGDAAAHRHAGFLSGFKSVALGADGSTRQANQLVFDDTTGRLRVKLAAGTGTTQCNLGHLIHQADNYRGSFRGTGWELRTDAYGALRAGRGLLMTTYYGRAPGKQPEPAGDNSAGIALLKQAQGFADTFNQAAATHQTVQFILVKGGAWNGSGSQSRIDDQLAPLAAMLNKVAGLVDARDGALDSNGRPIPHMHAPLVVVTAQPGIGVAASDGLHLAAGEVAHLASGRDTQVAVGEALSVHSGQALGMLAGAVGAGDDGGGIQLVAGQGDVVLQAQDDAMTLAAQELVRLISANSHIDFAAAKSITFCTEGGASMVLEGGNITFAGPGTVSLKGASKSFGGPASMTYPLPVMPRAQPVICISCLLKAFQAGSPLASLD